jgi:hypothetical protein
MGFFDFLRNKEQQKEFDKKWNAAKKKRDDEWNAAQKKKDDRWNARQKKKDDRWNHNQRRRDQNFNRIKGIEAENRKFRQRQRERNNIAIIDHHKENQSIRKAKMGHVTERVDIRQGNRTKRVQSRQEANIVRANNGMPTEMESIFNGFGGKVVETAGGVIGGLTGRGVFDKKGTNKPPDNGGFGSGNDLFLGTGNGTSKNNTMLYLGVGAAVLGGGYFIYQRSQ